MSDLDRSIADEIETELDLQDCVDDDFDILMDLDEDITEGLELENEDYSFSHQLSREINLRDTIDD
jgi:hypothetical protein